MPRLDREEVGGGDPKPGGEERTGDADCFDRFDLDEATGRPASLFLRFEPVAVTVAAVVTVAGGV